MQRCIVHLVRNSIRYIPRKDWSRFTKDLKAIYGAVNARQARERFEQFQKDWAGYPGAVAVWQNMTEVISAKKAQSERLALFIKHLKTQTEPVAEFASQLWASMVECVTVGKGMTVVFRDGTEIMI